ncbi:MAG: flagellar hook-length control protein FliK [Pseudomonadota bacterium]
MVDRITSGSRPVAWLEPLAPAASVADPRQEAFERLSRIAVGKQFQAEILSRLNDGSFLVRLADSQSDKSPLPDARMRLPAGTRVGASLDLTLVAKQPRPTFLLQQASAAPIRQAGADTTTLSNTGRLIGNLLQTVRQDSAPATLVGKAPLVASPAAGTAVIASALENTLARSGLFYESHVGQWAAGSRPLAVLLLEPQNQTATTASTAPASETPPPPVPHASAADKLAVPASGAPDLPPEEAPQPAAPRSPAAENHEPDSVSQLSAPGPESARLINLQLDTLEHRRVAWQGELWPNQPLSWEVSEHAPDRDAPEALPSWQSTVHFSLPSLGPVSATIRLAAGHVQVQVHTASDAAAETLRTHGAALAASMEAAGLPLDALRVKQHAAE